MTTRHTLSKSERLKGYTRIRTLFSKGEKLRSGDLLCYLAFSPGTRIPVQSGFGVASRLFKRAVDRNLIKRRMREAYRLNNGSLKTTLEQSNRQLDIFWIYVGSSLSDYSTIEQTMKNLLALVEKKISSHE
ncbi:MAG: ribonuclease P protein component [Bacteroidetes bacterium]|nr:ribonuclease P protein component [Bacteroidota bacterium]